MTSDLHLDSAEVALLTDLYQLTMAASYLEHGFNDSACFSLSVRRLPPRRGYLVAAGTERFFEAVQALHFDAEALEYLDSLKLFKPEFLDYLSRFRFTGSIRALPEGTICFAEEPILEVDAPLIEAQMLETLAINQVGVATMIASKAARCFGAAAGRRLIEFGLRRSHGADAGLVAARASYMAGFNGTASVLAGKRYGIPVYGTMAHSYIMAHERERDAFADFVKSFPTLSTLLIDTYDTVKGAENAAAVALELKQAGVELLGVRLDSGDLADLSKRVRKSLDGHGLAQTSIFASGNLDEYAIAEIVRGKAPIDAFGVGTAMVVSADAPSLDMTYKLVEYKGRPRVKTSRNKMSLPGRKQVFRAWSRAGVSYLDLVGLVEESPATVAREFKPSADRITELLVARVQAGTRIEPTPTLAQSRELFLDGFAKLDPRLKALERPETYKVRYTAALNAMQVSEKLKVAERQR
ncbi:MAG TPA: nicotinate phosphoribosyltransferase [Candidatus Binataceae bacterium]|jgi:nicotinate phosphoribosyltransferase|nr:nicotinate phosphoribosyltransferase [Candidatus Binataceae bacterium]